MADAETSAGQGSVIDAKRFRMIELVTLEDLLEHPVWADFQGDRDRTRILSWGVSEACLEDAIERYDYCGRSPLYPVLELENTEDFSNPTIALRIALPGGGFATGYRMGDLAVGVFLGDEEYCLNPKLPSRSRAEFDRLARALGCEPAELGPLRYESVAELGTKGRVQGVFERV